MGCKSLLLSLSYHVARVSSRPFEGESRGTEAFSGLTSFCFSFLSLWCAKGERVFMEPSGTACSFLSLVTRPASPHSVVIARRHVPLVPCCLRSFPIGLRRLAQAFLSGGGGFILGKSLLLRDSNHRIVGGSRLCFISTTCRCAGTCTARVHCICNATGGSLLGQYVLLDSRTVSVPVVARVSITVFVVDSWYRA